MHFSIIIPSYNTKLLLHRCLDSIFKSLTNTTLTYEIIVVDNASTDGSQDLVKKQYPQIHLIANTHNVGYGKANNQAIDIAKGEYILLLNSDIDVVGNAIEVLYQFACQNPSSFIGGKLLNEDLSPQASCGHMYHLPIIFLMLFLKGDKLQITRSSPMSKRRVDWISGACIIGKKTDFIHVGLFDEEIFMYMEEIDFLYRAGKKRYTIMFYPEAKFIHAGAASSSNKRTPVINIYRGLLFFYQKHKPKWQLTLLRIMLRWKGYAALLIGKLKQDAQLITVYEKALAMVDQ